MPIAVGNATVSVLPPAHLPSAKARAGARAICHAVVALGDALVVSRSAAVRGDVGAPLFLKTGGQFDVLSLNLHPRVECCSAYVSAKRAGREDAGANSDGVGVESGRYDL